MDISKLMQLNAEGKLTDDELAFAISQLKKQQQPKKTEKQIWEEEKAKLVEKVHKHTEEIRRNQEQRDYINSVEQQNLADFLFLAELKTRSGDRVYSDSTISGMSLGERQSLVDSIREEYLKTEEGAKKLSQIDKAVAAAKEKSNKEAELFELEREVRKEINFYYTPIVGMFTKEEQEEIKDILTSLQEAMKTKDPEIIRTQLNNLKAATKEAKNRHFKRLAMGVGLNFATELTGEQLVAELKKLNPDAEIEVESLVDLKITTTAEPKDLKLPKGFEYNEKNGITNKHKTQSGKYITCAVEKRERKTDWKLEELVEELQKLNPDAEIKLVGFVKPYIRTNAEPEKLKLPAGFSYTKEDGITNKGKTDGKVISCNVVQEKKKEKVEDESRIPFGQRFKVTKERKASIAKYAAAILKGAGVAAIMVAAWPGLAFTGGTLLAGTAIGGGLAASIEYLLQKFYDGRKKEEDPDLKEGNIKGFFKKLKNKYKEYRKNKEQQKQEAEKKEILADLEENYLDLRNEIDAFLSENAPYIIDADKEQMTALYKEVKEAIDAEDVDLITEKIKTLDTEFFLLSLKVSKQKVEAKKTADEKPQEINAQDLNGEALDEYLNDINEMFLNSEAEPVLEAEPGRKM